MVFFERACVPDWVVLSPSATQGYHHYRECHDVCDDLSGYVHKWRLDAHDHDNQHCYHYVLQGQPLHRELPGPADNVHSGNHEERDLPHFDLPGHEYDHFVRATQLTSNDS